MLHFGSAAPRRRTPVPRGIATTGPAILSYGFRPFFLGAGAVAVIDMVLWLGALSGHWTIGGETGPISWHGHEMLFGYATAALAGFVLTAVPNWTGRLPVSGRPLLGLVALWLLGRIVQLAPGILGDSVSAALDLLFLPVLAFVVGREVVVGRNAQNLRVAIAIVALGLLDLAWHVTAISGADQSMVVRATAGLYLMLVSHIGGRIVPSFTRNVLARAGRSLPRPMGWIDRVALSATVLAVASWIALPGGWATALAAAAAATLQAWRLAGWRGWATLQEPLLWVLHLGYGFVPLALAAIALAALGVVSPPSALHVLTVGVIGVMTLAVMTRATRGHTGGRLAASVATTVSYGALAAAALVRPFAELLPGLYHPILALSASFWIIAFVLFLAEHAPMLLAPRH